MDLDATRTITLTLRESMTLRTALDSYLREFSKHRDQAGRISHPEAEWQQMQREVHGLQSRLAALGRGKG
jgi:hypothetical protein